MLGRWVMVVAAAALMLCSAADAKELTKVLVVGANGHAVDLGGSWAILRQMHPLNATAPKPSGEYVLVYPLMEKGLPMEPGRYFPAERVACWSWTMARGECVSVAQLPEGWSATSALTSFSAEPTTLVALRHNRARYTVPSNFTIAVELALLRTDNVRPAPHARCAWLVRAQWRGPEAAVRPASLCVRVNGVSARGRLYPMPRAVAKMLRTAAWIH
jgi:hypothetical protein